MKNNLKKSSTSTHGKLKLATNFVSSKDTNAEG